MYLVGFSQKQKNRKSKRSILLFKKVVERCCWKSLLSFLCVRSYFLMNLNWITSFNFSSVDCISPLSRTCVCVCMHLCGYVCLRPCVHARSPLMCESFSAHLCVLAADGGQIMFPPPVAAHRRSLCSCF